MASSACTFKWGLIIIIISNLFLLPPPCSNQVFLIYAREFPRNVSFSSHICHSNPQTAQHLLLLLWAFHSWHSWRRGNLIIATMDDVRGANTVWVTQVTSPQPTNPHGARAPWGSKRRKGEWTSPQFYSILWCAQEESLWHPDDKVSHANSSFIFSASGGDSVWGSSYSRV